MCSKDSLGPKASSYGQQRLNRLDECPGWSKSLLGEQVILLVVSCCSYLLCPSWAHQSISSIWPRQPTTSGLVMSGTIPLHMGRHTSAIPLSVQHFVWSRWSATVSFYSLYSLKGFKNGDFVLRIHSTFNNYQSLYNYWLIIDISRERKHWPDMLSDPVFSDNH